MRGRVRAKVTGSEPECEPTILVEMRVSVISPVYLRYISRVSPHHSRGDECVCSVVAAAPLPPRLGYRVRVRVRVRVRGRGRGRARVRVRVRVPPPPLSPPPPPPPPPRPAPRVRGSRRAPPLPGTAGLVEDRGIALDIRLWGKGRVG